MKKVIMFPGQFSQCSGIGKDWFGQLPRGIGKTLELLKSQYRIFEPAQLLIPLAHAPLFFPQIIKLPVY